MKPINTRVICFSSFILLNILSSCEDTSLSNYKSFLIQVDSIQAPDNILEKQISGEEKMKNTSS